MRTRRWIWALVAVVTLIAALAALVQYELASWPKLLMFTGIVGVAAFGRGRRTKMRQRAPKRAGTADAVVAIETPRCRSPAPSAEPVPVTGDR